MSMIKIENLTFSYPGSCENVFENACIQIDTDWRLGFVGRNGRGKTTLLNLLLGKYEYKGKIISSVQFDYFPYIVSDASRQTSDVLNEVCPAAEEWELIKELSMLDVNADVLYRPFNTLSNGEQTKVLLAALFLNEGRFLLIDEPTNHLDIAAREKAAEYLKKKKGFILVSHDRHFLDMCVDHILSLNKTDIEVQSGNFSSFMTNFERRQDYEQSQNDKLQKEVKHLKQAARRSASWSDKTEASKFGEGPVDRGFVGHKAAKMMKRSKVIEARQARAVEEKSKLLKNLETAESLKIHPLPYRTDTLVALSGVSVYYGDKAVNPPVSFSVKQGERIALDGKNGCGKSSILKLICGADISCSGEMITGSGLIISYVPQDTSPLKGRLKSFIADNHIDESLFKTILRKMDFSRDLLDGNISDFSAGQKKKVLIAKSLSERAHLYVWDEPLNYIDIYSRMQIEELINAFSPAMIFVEHDKSFREAVGAKIISM